MRFALMGKKTTLVLSIAAVTGLLIPRALDAHPVSLTSSLIDVGEEAVSVEMEVLVEDLVLYYRLEHDGEFLFPTGVLQRQAREHGSFLLNYFQLRDGEGQRLDGEVTGIDFSEFEDKPGIHFDDLMAYSLIYELRYPLREPLEHLTVSQEFGGADPIIPAEMEVSVFHGGARVDTRVDLSHRTAHTFTLDPSETPGAKTDLETARERRRERRDETLGITSYSAVYSYVYVTDTEVRHEMLIPLLTLEEWVRLERSDPDFLTVEEQEAARPRIDGFLRQQQRLEIDGTVSTPRLQRVEFFGPGIRDFAAGAPERKVSVYNTRVGVIFSHPVEAPPREMTFAWRFYEERLPLLRPRIYVFEEEGHDALLTPARPSFSWQRETEREFGRLIEPPPPEIAEAPRIPLAILLGGAAAVLLAVAGVRAAGRSRRVCFGVAGVLVLGVMVARQVTTPLPAVWFSPPGVAAEEARSIFQTLHGNIHRAFDYREEERIYDALAGSVAGPLLEELYLQVRRQLTVEDQGGAVSRVDGIELLEGQKEPLPGRSRFGRGFVYRSSWTVTGTVEHWGHIHTRTNRHEGVFTVETVEGRWKITEFEPLAEEPVRRSIRVRDF